MKKANMGMSTVITSLNIIFQHDALQNVTRAGQLVGHNLRIQLQEMLHGIQLGILNFLSILMRSKLLLKVMSCSYIRKSC
jgi:hypothetical protein